MARIDLTTRAGRCPIHVGTNLSGSFTAELQKQVKADRLFLVVDKGFIRYNRHTLERTLRGCKRDPIIFEIEPSERIKSSQMLNKLHDWLLSKQVTRQDFLLAVGGGIVTDLAGYAAATILRGIRWGAVPTTLLGMVDAAIGGKTGINHRSGKNLIGAFWQPSFVLCDVAFLRSLSEREIVSGLGEVVKYAGLMGKSVTKDVGRYLDTGRLSSTTALTELVTLSARYKAWIVAQDEREGEKRMWLNFGHTFAHGIEYATGFKRLPHGMAVTLGCLAAVELSCTLNPRMAPRFDDYRRVLLTMIKRIPVVTFDLDKTLKAMEQDKKRSSSGIRFVLLRKPGTPYIAEHVDMKAVRDALTRMRDLYRQYGGKRA